MTVDLSAAAGFTATHARLLDRRRFDLLFGGGDDGAAAGAVLAAVEAHRNPDGGYGWGLKPDLRPAPASRAVRCTPSRRSTIPHR